MSCVCVIENKDCPPNARTTIHLTGTSLFGRTSCFWSGMKVTPNGNQFQVDCSLVMSFYTDAKDAKRRPWVTFEVLPVIVGDAFNFIIDE